MNQYLLSIMKGQRKGIIPFLIVLFLLPWSLVYCLGVFCHQLYCRVRGVYRAPKPVISIGNITVGGTGKTPLVIWLAKNLQSKGLKSIILIRGYKPKASKVSDEVDMLNEQLPYTPVLAGSSRAANIREAEDIMPVDLYICDDAFQHWPLHRDLNIVAINAANPFGNGFMLPAGVLREPLFSLKRADVFMLTKTDGIANTQDLRARLKGINPHALVMESQYRNAAAIDAFEEESLGIDYLKQKNVVGICAIGDPLSFEASLSNSGAQIIKLFKYMDHHAYRQGDIKALLAFCRKNDCKVLVATHKDVVKLRAFKDLFEGFCLVYLPIQLEVTKGADEFFQKITDICFH